MYSRPRAGKLSAWPVHPMGWLVVFGAPVPGIVAGALVGALFGRPWGLIAATLSLAATLFGAFRLIVRRGRPIG